MKCHWLVALVAVAACRAASIPASQRYPAGTPLVPRMVSVNTHKLRVIDTGRGPTVVLVHGFAASLYAWRYTVPTLTQAGYHVVAFDNLGFWILGQAGARVFQRGLCRSAVESDGLPGCDRCGAGRAFDGWSDRR